MTPPRTPQSSRWRGCRRVPSRRTPDRRDLRCHYPPSAHAATGDERWTPTAEVPAASTTGAEPLHHDVQFAEIVGSAWAESDLHVTRLGNTVVLLLRALDTERDRMGRTRA